MSKLDRMQQIIDASKPINPNSEKILKELVRKAVPMISYYMTEDVGEAIFNDAMDEGLSATEIHIAVMKLYNSGAYNGYLSLLGDVDYRAEKQLNSERSADLARMNEAAEEKKMRRTRKKKETQS